VKRDLIKSPVVFVESALLNSPISMKIDSLKSSVSGNSNGALYLGNTDKALWGGFD